MPEKESKISSAWGPRIVTYKGAGKGNLQGGKVRPSLSSLEPHWLRYKFKFLVSGQNIYKLTTTAKNISLLSLAIFHIQVKTQVPLEVLSAYGF